MMMISPKAARRYAEALYGLAKAEGSLDRVLADMKAISIGVRGAPDLAEFLADYTVPMPKRLGALEALFKKGSHELSWRFLVFLESKKRMALLAGICEAMARLNDLNMGVVDVDLKTALPADSRDVDMISGEIKRKLTGVMRLATVTDSSLIGGFTFQVGDTVYDYSVRGSLQALRKKLENG